MEPFREVPLDAPVPVCTVVRSGRPLWFRERGEILERYPGLRDAHERTEAVLGTDAVQGGVVPLVVDGRVEVVLVIGFRMRPDVERSGRHVLAALVSRFARALRH